MIRSMTGFGSAVQSEADVTVRIEARSVNHRHLQIKARLPQEHQNLESDVEGIVRRHAERGAFSISVSLERPSGVAPVKIDAGVARAYQREIAVLAAELGVEADVALDTLLGMPGVLAAAEDDARRDREGQLLLACLDKALLQLIEMREREGQHLLADVEKNAQGIGKVAAKLEKRMPKALKEHHKNLHKRVSELLSGTKKGSSGRVVAIEPADLARELALLADKMDVSEEFARLGSHLAQLEKLLASGKPVGRQLDFLVQEFFREANTIGSKCNDAEAAHAVVELKTLIERLREQVQNVE